VGGRKQTTRKVHAVLVGKSPAERPIVRSVCRWENPP